MGHNYNIHKGKKGHVIPANAGIQRIITFIKLKVRDWIPVFTGMTKVKKIFHKHKKILRKAGVLVGVVLVFPAPPFYLHSFPQSD